MIECNGRKIGPGNPCFIIAEAGVNHNGRVDLACQLVDAAAAAGADAVKFQTWITEKLVSPETEMAPYQKSNLQSNQSQFLMLKELEMSQDNFRIIKGFCEKRGILFLSTPDEEESADFLESLGVPLFKIGSAELDNLNYLRHVAAKERPIILSTGMGSLEEVKLAVEAIRAHGKGDLILLQCVSDYPARISDSNLLVMKTLEREFNCPVGFSDHSLGIHIPFAAVALGACVVEKHLTLDKTMLGPDHSCSIDPKEFKAMVEGIRDIEQALGSGLKVPTPEELQNRKLMRKSLVAKRCLPAGSILNESDLQLRRATDGISQSDRAKVVGRPIKKDVIEGEVLHWSLLA